jgi:hypothetical protein
MGLGLHAPLSRLLFPFNSMCARHLHRRQMMVLNYHRVGTPAQKIPAWLQFPKGATVADATDADHAFLLDFARQRDRRA